MKRSAELNAGLRCKDYMVSGEYFTLEPCSRYEMLVTSPQPSPDELPHYYESNDYISHSDSNSGMMNKVYQLVKFFMLSRKLSWIREFHSAGKLLDVGAGTGDFLLEAKKKGYEVHGTEPSSSARKLAADKGIVLEQEGHEFGSDTFDVITMWHVLEHVVDLEGQLRELERMLKPGGLLVIAVPNYKSYDAKKYGEFWAAYDVPRHLWHFSRKSIQELFAEKGFNMKVEHPLKFDAYYVSLLSEKYKTGTWKPLSAIGTAIKSNQCAKRSGEYSSIASFFTKTQI